MNSQFRQFGIVMAANLETVIYLLGAWYGYKWLDENYPASFSWKGPMFGLALAGIARSWYHLIMVLLRNDEESDEGK